MKKKIRASLSALILLFAALPAYAEVYHYIDRAGEAHFVDDLSEVPEQYRGQVKNAGSLPSINVMGHPGPPLESSSGNNAAPATEKPQKRVAFNGTVEVFMTTWCGYCRKLESFLADKGIPYSSYDIEKDSSASKVYKELGGRGVPLSRIGSTVVRGYNPQAILKAVQE